MPSDSTPFSLTPNFTLHKSTVSASSCCGGGVGVTVILLLSAVIAGCVTRATSVTRAKENIADLKGVSMVPRLRPVPDQVTVMPGQTAVLSCVAENLGNRLVVSWIRSSDLQILTSGRIAFTSDTRFSTEYTAGGGGGGGGDAAAADDENEQPNDNGVSGSPLSLSSSSSSSSTAAETIIQHHPYHSQHSHLSSSHRNTSLSPTTTITTTTQTIDSWNLIITNVRTKDSGQYECQINTEPKMKINVTLWVREPQLMDTPFSGTVIEAPREQVVKSGTTITFSCRATSPFPLSSMTAPVPPSPTDIINVVQPSPAATVAARSLSSSSSTSSLLLPVADGDGGTVTSLLASLQPPSPSPRSFNDTKTNNHSTKHAAIWSMNGQPIRAKNGRAGISVFTEWNVYEVTSTLTLASARVSDTGMYACHVNGIGTDQVTLAVVKGQTARNHPWLLVAQQQQQPLNSATANGGVWPHQYVVIVCVIVFCAL